LTTISGSGILQVQLLWDAPRMSYLAPEWRVAHRLWSVRLAVFWMIFSGLWVALPAFQGWLPPLRYALVCIGFAVAIGVARLTNQKGLVV